LSQNRNIDTEDEKLDLQLVTSLKSNSKETVLQVESRRTAFLAKLWVKQLLEPKPYFQAGDWLRPVSGLDSRLLLFQAGDWLRPVSGLDSRLLLVFTLIR
jgi:hypothetical protein